MDSIEISSNSHLITNDVLITKKTDKGESTTETVTGYGKILGTALGIFCPMDELQVGDNTLFVMKSEATRIRADLAPTNHNAIQQVFDEVYGGAAAKASEAIAARAEFTSAKARETEWAKKWLSGSAAAEMRDAVLKGFKDRTTFLKGLGGMGYRKEDLETFGCLHQDKAFLYYHDSQDQTLHICKPTPDGSVLDFRIKYDYQNTEEFQEKAQYLIDLFKNPNIAFVGNPTSENIRANSTKTVVYVDKENAIHIKPPYAQGCETICEQTHYRTMLSLRDKIDKAIATKAPDPARKPDYESTVEHHPNMKIITYTGSSDIPKAFVEDPKLEYLIYRRAGCGKYDGNNYNCFKRKGDNIYKLTLTVNNESEMQRLVNSSFTKMDERFERISIHVLAQQAGMILIENRPVGGEHEGEWPDEIIADHYERPPLLIDRVVPLEGDTPSIENSPICFFTKTKDEQGKDIVNRIVVDGDMSDMEFLRRIRKEFRDRLKI